jgi:DNA adenine methylase
VHIQETRGLASSSDARGCRPFLRWAGSKLKLVPALEAYWQTTHGTYIEPFAGSACLYFHLSPQKAVLGDNNAALIELYEVLRDRPSRIVRRLAHIPRNSESYYRWRNIQPEALDKETRALRLLYLNRHCFNGIFRTNDAGRFNVPFGTRLGQPLSAETIYECAQRLRDVELVAGDFMNTVRLAKPGDLVYMDPPFAMSTKRDRRQYGHASFSHSDIARLNDAMFALNATGVDFLVSYGDCPEARMLARNWNYRRVRVRRHVSGFASSRRNAYELIISNFIAPLEGCA